jgi:hypothetical protein
MREYLSLAGPFGVLLAIVTTLRLVLGNVSGVPYTTGSDKVSIVVLTLTSALLYGAFTRRYLGFRLLQAALMGVTLGLVSQVVIFVMTFLSYGLGTPTYFNHPMALGQPEAAVVPIPAALGVRLGGLLINSLGCGIGGALGFSLGALLPRPKS